MAQKGCISRPWDRPKRGIIKYLLINGVPPRSSTNTYLNTLLYLSITHVQDLHQDVDLKRRPSGYLLS